MRVLFLDFDGVLHPALDEDEVLPPGLVPCTHFGWLPHLEQLLRPHPDVRVVVHSSWRYTHNAEELALLLGPLGKRFVGATPRAPRWESVNWFLHLNKQVKDFRILDDGASQFPNPPPPQLVLCDPHHGVSDPLVLQRLGRWLRGEPEWEVP